MAETTGAAGATAPSEGAERQRGEVLGDFAAGGRATTGEENDVGGSMDENPDVDSEVGGFGTNYGANPILNPVLLSTNLESIRKAGRVHC